MTSDNEYKAKRHYRDSKIAEAYDGERFATWYGRLAHRIEAEALARAAALYFKSPGTVLDVPCGTGRLLPVLQGAGLTVSGGDISEEMMAVARKRFASDSKISFYKVDAEKLPFEAQTFDYVTSYRLMCHLPPEARSRVLGEMIRVCRKKLVINYHVAAMTPLYVFNSLFRKHTAIAYPLNRHELRLELAQRKDVRLIEMRSLRWFERSSLLVVLEKVQ